LVQIAITSKNASFWAVGTSNPKHVVPNLRRSLALNVDTPESLDRPVDQFSAMLGIGDIAWSQNAPPARLFDEPLRLVGVVVSIEIGDQRSASSLAKAKATARPRLAVDARKFSQCERGQIGRGPDPEILAVMSSPVISRR
jgi:hypothetical protein